MNGSRGIQFMILLLMFIHACATSTLLTPIGNFSYEPNLSPVIALDTAGNEVGVGLRKNIVLTGDDVYLNTDQNLKNLDRIADHFLPEPPKPDDDIHFATPEFSAHFRSRMKEKPILIQDSQEEEEIYLPASDASLRKQKELTLLAMCIYGEARSEPYEGKLSIAFVAVNRVEEKSWYGRTLKDVLLKPYQFSCFNRNDPNYPKLFIPKRKEWIKCFKAAWNAYSALTEDPTAGANHYCRYDISPPWINMMEFKTRIGHHEFYKATPQAVLEWWYAHYPHYQTPNTLLLNHSLLEELKKIQFLIQQYEMETHTQKSPEFTPQKTNFSI